MGANSAIEWTKHTWNPWVGCFKVSPGCKQCYMYREQRGYGQDPMEIRRTKSPTFNAPLKWHEKDPGLVFTSSWTDFFLEEADPAWRAEAWDIIRKTPGNTYQILTKRIDKVLDMLPDDWGSGWPNVWIGTSVENQAMADLRIPHLLKVPAIVRFLSCEPLLDYIDLTEAGAIGEEVLVAKNVTKDFDYLISEAMIANDGAKIGSLRAERDEAEPSWSVNLVDWVIVGGESGPAAKARPMSPYWARDLLNQCQEHMLPFFFKQWGQWYTEPKPGQSRDVGRYHEVNGEFHPIGWRPKTPSHEIMMFPMGNTKVPARLNGQEWKEFPTAWDNETQKMMIKPQMYIQMTGPRPTGRWSPFTGEFIER